MNIINKLPLFLMVLVFCSSLFCSSLYGSNTPESGQELTQHSDGQVNLIDLNVHKDIGAELAKMDQFNALEPFEKYKSRLRENVELESKNYQKKITLQNKQGEKTTKSYKNKTFQKDKYGLSLPYFQGKPVQFTNQETPEVFYGENASYTLEINQEKKTYTVTEDLTLIYPKNLRMSAKKFIKQRAFEKQQKIEQNHPFFRPINHYKQVEKNNSHALTSLGIGILSGILGLTMLHASSTDKISTPHQSSIPLVIAAIGFVGYGYFINRGKKAAEPLYQKELEADADAVKSGKDNAEKLDLVQGGLNYLKNEDIPHDSPWKLEDPNRWLTVPTSAPLHKRIKQLKSMETKIKNEDL